MSLGRKSLPTTTLAVVAALATVLTTAGCRSWQIGHSPLSLPYACESNLAAKSVSELLDDSQTSNRQAAVLEKAGNDGCVDWYFASTRYAWLAAQLCDHADHATSKAHTAY